MGQRSQIYVRVNDMAGRKFLAPRCYQWNFGERMVSRARHILEWLKMYEGWPYSLCMGDNHEKLKKIMDTNFDYHDVVLGIDLIKEYKETVEYFKDRDEEPSTFKESVFDGQDNNDGQLFIDVIVDYEHKNKKGYPKVTYKYAFFMDYDEDHRKPLGPDEYMQADFRDDPNDPDYEPWRESSYFKECVKYTERNIRYIEKHAQLMTQEEALEFTAYNYLKDIMMEV